MDSDPIICPECNGTGQHPWKAGSVCPRCQGSGEIGDDVYDDRYKKTIHRAVSGCSVIC